MNVRNYTSSVPVEITLGRIEHMLAGVGADQVNKQYADGKVKSLSFMFLLGDQRFVFRLPAKSESLFELWKKEKRRVTPDGLRSLRAQAERTSWRLMEDWISIQFALIRMKQVDFMQVFLPFALVSPEVTLYEQIAGGGFKMLPNAREAQEVAG